MVSRCPQGVESRFSSFRSEVTDFRQVLRVLEASLGPASCSISSVGSHVHAQTIDIVITRNRGAAVSTIPREELHARSSSAAWRVRTLRMWRALDAIDSRTDLADVCEGQRRLRAQR